MLLLVRYKICIKKKGRWGEVKQSGVKRSEKEYAAQPHYMGLVSSQICLRHPVLSSTRTYSMFITLLTQLSLDYNSIS